MPMVAMFSSTRTHSWSLVYFRLSGKFMAPNVRTFRNPDGGTGRPYWARVNWIANPAKVVEVGKVETNGLFELYS